MTSGNQRAFDTRRDTTQPRATVLCAIRGGPFSQYTVQRAMQIAQERHARLVFLYVVDAEFLGYATVGRPRVVLRELRTTGEFMMSILRDRAIRQGVDADYVVRTGDVRRQIVESVRWQDADVLVMGRPIRSPGSDTFTEETLAEFVDRVVTKTGVEVVLADTTVALPE